MTIHIEQLTFETIIGLLDFERVTPQRVIINLEIDYPYEANYFINYAEIIALIEADMREAKYELLESAIETLLQKLTTTYPQITKIFFKITKPNIIKNAHVALSSTWSKTQCHKKQL